MTRVTPPIAILLRAACLLIAGVAALSPAAAQMRSAAENQTRAIRAGALVTPDGEIQRDALIVIDGGKIRQVGGQAPAGVPVDEFPGATLSPGLIDAAASLGAVGNLNETANPIEASARAADVLNPFHPHFRAAAKAGVTAIALLPGDQNLIGGRAAIVHTAGAHGPDILEPAGPYKVSLSPAAFLPDREPTSRSGAVAMLRAALRGARAGEAGGRGATGDLGAANTRCFFAAPSGADVLAALELAQTYKLDVTVVHMADARDVASEVAALASGAVVGPYDFSTPERAGRAAGQFEAAGVRVAIAGGLPWRAPDSLRIGAAVATRDGMSPAAARRAIATTPAELLGVADRIGSLKPGLRADVVVFSGDPLDLRSRVLAVYSGGKRIAADAPTERKELSR